MSANNQVVIIGRAGNKPLDDIRRLQSGSAVAEVRLAVNRPGKDANGNTQTDWISCQFWNKNAERLCEFVGKGDLISVSGSLRVDNWEQDGQRRQKYFVHGENFQMLESRAARQERNDSPGQQYGLRSDPATASSNATYKLPKDPVDDYALDDSELPPF